MKRPVEASVRIVDLMEDSTIGKDRGKTKKNRRRNCSKGLKF